MTKKSIHLIILFFLFRAVAPAQESVTLTLDQAIKMGLDSSRNLRISQTRLTIAQAKYNQAMDAVLPVVRLSGNYTRLSDIDMPKILFPGAAEPIALFPVYVNNYSAGLSVSETVFSGFRLKYARESQRLLQQAAGFDFNKDKDEIALNIINAYINLYKINSSLKVLDQNLAQVKERIRETDLAEKNGMATHNDVLRWQLQESNIELTGIDLRSNRDVSNYNLNLMLGMSGNVTIQPDSTTVNANESVSSLDEYMRTAAKNRNDLAATAIRTKASQNNLKVAENSDLPRLSVGAEFLDANPNPRYIPPVNEFRSTWSVGLTLNWDLVSLYSNRHNVDEARALYRQNVETEGLMNDVIKSEVNQSYLGYTQSVEKILVMQKAVEQAQENYRLMDSRYKNNFVTLSDLLEANSSLLSSQINLELAKADKKASYYRLLKSVSTLTNTSSK